MNIFPLISFESFIYRNNLYRLGLKSLSLLQNVTWQVTNDIAEYCRARGRTEHDCHNYITVLLKNGSQLLACGTYASKPLCTWREVLSYKK